MNLFNIKKSNAPFGLDIGFETIKLIQIEQFGKQKSLIGAIEVPLTDRILEQDRFRNIADTANLIKDSMKKAKPYPITAKKFVSALPETFVFSKTIELPKMTSKEYAQAVPAEASQYLPIPIEEVYLDYQILAIHPDKPVVDVLVVTAPKKLVDDYIEIAKLAGLELAALETKPLAVGRAVLSEKETDGTAIVHIGTEYSRISIWDNNNARLTSTVPIGQNQLFECLGYMTGLPPKDTTLKLTDHNKQDCIIPLGSIADELIKAIKYHQNRSYSPKPIKKIILCGSGLIVEGLDKYFEHEVKIKTETAKIKFNNDKIISPQFIVAYGLAMRNDF